MKLDNPPPQTTHAGFHSHPPSPFQIVATTYSNNALHKAKKLLGLTPLSQIPLQKSTLFTNNMGSAMQPERNVIGHTLYLLFAS